VKYWEIIADNLKKAGWSLGWVSAIDSEGRTIWIADAHRDDGKRFVVHADEKLTAFCRATGLRVAQTFFDWITLNFPEPERRQEEPVSFFSLVMVIHRFRPQCCRTFA
jgi:hypothetical protein